DSDETVRQVAVHCVSLRRDQQAVPALVDLLQKGTSHNQRVAAEALGRLGEKSTVPALLSATGRLDPHASDRILEHSLISALIEIADPQQSAAGLARSNSETPGAALIALDQMQGGGLNPKAVAKLLASSDALLKQTASWVIGRHHDWGEALVESLHER